MRSPIDRRNHFVHPQHSGAQLLVVEGIVAEDGLRISMSSFVVPRLTSKLLCGHRGSESGHDERQRDDEYD